MTQDTGSITPDAVVDLPSLVMFTAPNPGPKTLSGTHSFVVGHHPAYVIDPGPAIKDYLGAMAQWVTEQNIVVEGILLTHSHPDHAPGAPLLAGMLDAPVLASADMPEDIARGLCADALLNDGDTLRVAGDVLRVVATPGHAHDHIAFWLEGARVLFAGDTILGEGTTVIAPPEGDMSLYMQTLERIRELRPYLIAPGHGPLIRDPGAKLEEYVAHRRQREEQIIQALERGPATIEELVARVYADVDPGLHGLAAGSVEAQLIKLTREGRAAERGNLYALAPAHQ